MKEIRHKWKDIYIQGLEELILLNVCTVQSNPQLQGNSHQNSRGFFFQKEKKIHPKSIWNFKNRPIDKTILKNQTKQTGYFTLPDFKTYRKLQQSKKKCGIKIGIYTSAIK